ncbi:MAG TPA: hypothetical protein VFN23_08575, partial [Ktedonobacteraceae bacterium]|nr:hypothetical protein [Ktedonobacteraceae bacterium]
MTLQSLISTLLDADEAEGRRLLTTIVTQLNAEDLAQLVDRIKRAADQQWITDAYLSFVLSGHLMAIGELSEQKSYHALGLMARGDALRRLD